jgi:predicted esterase/tetratricopeptide (TPR) repeat protein
MNSRAPVQLVALTVLAFVTTLTSIKAQSQEYFVELRNGIRLGPGKLSKTATISNNAAQRGLQGAGEPIYVLDDELRFTYFNSSAANVIGAQLSNAPPQVVVELPYKGEVETNAGEMAILGVLRLGEFNKFGRRTYSIMLPKGPKHLLQAITAISPTYTKIETLRVSDSIKWDQRIATSTIPPNVLKEILHHQLDLSRPSEWKRIIQLYLEAERYKEAKDELEEALAKFPTDFAAQRSMLEKLDVLRAKQLFNQAKLWRNSGQHQRAAQVLLTFPLASLPIEIQLEVQNQVEGLKTELQTVAQITEAIKTDVGKLPAAEQPILEPLVKEIVDEVGLDSVVRLSDYQRLRNDETLSGEQRVSLALSGWLLGAGAGLDNLATTKSLTRVRPLVQRYLVEADEPKRAQILEQIQAEEGGQADHLVKLLANMKPPMQPPAVNEKDPPGLYRMSIPDGAGTVDYLVQTPPEYDPNRTYPCVLALPGMRVSTDYQVDWWCGPFEPNTKQRYGHATRYGYIVVSPAWARDHQTNYDYTEWEHQRILRCLRDSLRHFSIDTNRVFISGHLAGAAAAWDLALAHPDLWAGAVLISPNADKFIIHYSEKNARVMPIYAVYGEYDASGFKEQIGKTLDKYVSSPRYDALAVEYRGREGGYFPEELPRIIEWMELSSHRRQRAPTDIDVATMRSGDRFFYWLEAVDYQTANNALVFSPQSATIGAKLIPQENLIRVTNVPGRSLVVWLSPEMVDFKRTVIVSAKGKTKRLDVASDPAVILEDARTRADRLHPFHFKVQFP